MADKQQTEDGHLDHLERVRMLRRWLEEKQGQDILVLDVSQLCAVTEALVLVTASNARHAQALADHLLARLAENKIELLGLEGYRTGAWILVDINDVLVHIFQGPNRQFYNLEDLWAEAEPIETGEEFNHA
jgi:ribosome-associated protein